MHSHHTMLFTVGWLFLSCRNAFRRWHSCPGIHLGRTGAWWIKCVCSVQRFSRVRRDAIFANSEPTNIDPATQLFTRFTHTSFYTLSSCCFLWALFSSCARVIQSLRIPNPMKSILQYSFLHDLLTHLFTHLTHAAFCERHRTFARVNEAVSLRFHWYRKNSGMIPNGAVRFGTLLELIHDRAFTSKRSFCYSEHFVCLHEPFPLVVWWTSFFNIADSGNEGRTVF